MIPQAQQLQRLNVHYSDALQAAVAAHSTDDAAQRTSELGSQARTMGLDTLELTQIHQRALQGLTRFTSDPEALVRITARAKVFFDATLTVFAGRTWNHHDRAYAGENLPGVH